MQKIKFLTLLIISLAIPFAATAQSKSRNQRAKAKASVVTPMDEAYLDSLKTYKQRIDSLMTANDSLKNANVANAKYYRYFVPLTFYPDITGRMLNNNDASKTAEDVTLMGLYIKRPDLMKYSSKKLADIETRNEGETGNEPEKMQLAKDASGGAVAIAPIPEGIDKEDVNLYVAKPKFWKFSGDYYLQFMQNYVSPNWYKSGSNNYSMLGAVTLKYDYNNKQKLKWENKLELKLGFVTSESDTINKFKSSEDLIRLTSKIGLQAHKNWYYTAQVIMNTQFAPGRKDNKTTIFSDFMSPFNMNISLGMDYTVKTNNGKLTGSVHIAPLAYNLKYVGRPELVKSFGLKEGTNTLSDFGSQFTVDLVWTPWNFFKWQMRMYGYTTYEKIVFECENTLSFKFNKFISANVFIFPRFDDGAKRVEDYSYWQFKEYLSLGFSYSM